MVGLVWKVGGESEQAILMQKVKKKKKAFSMHTFSCLHSLSLSPHTQGRALPPAYLLQKTTPSPGESGGPPDPITHISLPALRQRDASCPGRVELALALCICQPQNSFGGARRG